MPLAKVLTNNVNDRAQPAPSGFWLYQSAGWSLFALLQLLMLGSDEPLSLHTLLPALLLLVLALTGSLVLRKLYQRWRQQQHSQGATLGLLVGAALLCALVVDLLHYWLLWPLAQLPLLAKSPETPCAVNSPPRFLQHSTSLAAHRPRQRGEHHDAKRRDQRRIEPRRIDAGRRPA